MRQFEANQVINGTFGDAWVDDDYLGEIISGKQRLESHTVIFPVPAI